MKNKMIAMALGALVLGGGGGFLAGMKYQQSKQPVRQFGNQGQRGMGTRSGFRPVNGEIIISDDKSITIKLADGSSKIIFVSDKTMIGKAETATAADLKTGAKVAVFGQDNSDGTVTAQNIQLNPVSRSSN